MDQTTETICSACHQPILPDYYFCPNCGDKLRVPPLDTSSYAQMKVYAHSLVLPVLCFITISKWKGVHYLKSKDEKSIRIGVAACVILALSTVLVSWYAVTLAKSISQSAAEGISSDFNGY